MSGWRVGYRGRGHRAPRPGAPALRLDGLSVRYPGVTGPALQGVDLVVPRGVVAVLVGHNGSGKSTLLRAVAGLIRPAAGSIRVFGNPVGACHHRVAYLPQRSEVDWRFPVDVRGLVLSGRLAHLGWLRRPGPVDHALAEAAIERLGLAALAREPVARLSGGQRQRALLARALCQEADLLLLDEPLTAMDPEARDLTDGLVGDLVAAGRSVVMATHDLDRVPPEPGPVLRLAAGRPVREPAWAG
jgi:manganese/zinc/iron transport system ATP- binding protein